MRNKQTKFIIAVAGLFFMSLTGLVAQSTKTETGVASFYHDKFEGRKTANGEIFRQSKFTAAHKTLPLGTWVRVTNLSNDSTVIVKINDRMPLWNKRSIDLTEAAASQLNYISKGLTRVLIEIIPDPFKKTPFIRPDDLPLTYLSVPKTEQIGYSAPQPALKNPTQALNFSELTGQLIEKKKRR